MAEAHRWPGSRKRRHIKKVAREEAQKIVSSLADLQKRGDARLTKGVADLAECKTEAIDSLANVIAENMHEILSRKPEN